MNGRQPAPAIVGRESELGVLESVSADENGSAVLLVGSPGIGKSALLRVMADRARASGRRVLQATGSQSETAMPFAALHQLLRPVGDRLEMLWPKQREALRTAFGQIDGPPPDVYLVALAVLELLTGLAATDSLLVVVDDAHWIDSVSSQVLAFVGRRVAADPIAMVAAMREGYQSPLTAADLAIVRVDPLGEDAAVDMLRAEHPLLDEETRQRVLAAAEGNPLALVELPRTYGINQAVETESAPPLTERLEQSFAARLTELRPLTRLALIAAATDDTADLSVILQAAAFQSAATTVSVEVLSGALDAKLIEIRDRRVIFRHPLMRSAIYQSATLSERTHAHAAMAHLFVEVPERRAWHLAAAAVGPDEHVAYALELVATAAEQRGAREASVEAWERAAALSPDKSSRGSRLLRAAEILLALGDVGRAAELARIAEPIVEGFTQHIRVALVRDAVVPATPGDGARVDALADLALTAIESGHTDLAIQVLLAAAAHAWSGDPGRAARDHIIAATEQLNVDTDDPRRLSIIGYTDPSTYGPMIIERVKRMGLEELADPFAAELAVSVFIVGSDTAIASLQRKVVDDVRLRGQLASLPRVLLMQSWTAIAMANWAIAVPALDEARRLAEETRQPLWEASALLGQGLIDALHGDADSAYRLAQQAERIVLPLRSNPVLCGLQLMRGIGAIGRGHYDEAFSHLVRLFDPADPAFHQVQSVWAFGDMVEAGLRSGHIREVTEIADRIYRQTDTSLASPWSQAALHYARPLLADDTHADTAFQEALASSLSNWPWYRARLLLEYGSWLRRQYRIADARTPLRSARDSFDALAMASWAQRARHELRATGEAVGKQPVVATTVLSPQELQIAQLAADGLSNREIAQRLYLSHRTVGSHLYRLFPKLGVSSRGQLRSALERAR
ncbi:UNVERIFIED_CONTAM: regulatory LuxR family protein [Williamsia faeni]